MRIKSLLLFISIFYLIMLIGCKSPTKVIILEERDPIVKTIYEKDSLVIYPRDTTKVSN